MSRHRARKRSGVTHSRLLARLPGAVAHVAAKTLQPVASDSVLKLVPTTTFAASNTIRILHSTPARRAWRRRLSRTRPVNAMPRGSAPSRLCFRGYRTIAPHEWAMLGRSSEVTALRAQLDQRREPTAGWQPVFRWHAGAQRAGIAAPQCVITMSTLQGACSISVRVLEPRHHRAAQLSRCRWPTTIRSAPIRRA
jgi:hypothetical protein